MAAEKDNLDIPLIATIGFVSTVLTIASVIGVQALYNAYASRELERKVTLAPTADADSKLAEQEAKLARYGWTNRAEGQVMIPIERAMALVVADYAKRSTKEAGESFALQSQPREESDVPR